MWMWFLTPPNNYNSNIKDPLLQVTITNTLVMTNLEILQELPKYDTDTKWANADRKMAPIDLIDAGLLRTSHL